MINKSMKLINKEQKRRLIIADNISKRLKAILSGTNLKYICRGKLKPFIYRRVTANGLLPDKSRHNAWDCNFDEIICSNGMNDENDYATITVLFEDGSLFRLVPENIYFGNFHQVEYFFQQIKNYIFYKKLIVIDENPKAVTDKQIYLEQLIPKVKKRV